jgi:N-methylhydantoinase A
MKERSVIVGVDVGGTFTDLFLLDTVAGTFRTAKIPSRRGDEAQGFLNGLHALGSVSAIGSIVHGTTVGTNTLLERRGPKIGVIATRGFRDVLEMRRRDRRRTWGLWGDFVPIADRDMRLEVTERSRTEPSVRRLTRTRFAPLPRSCLDAAPRHWRSSSSTPTSMRKTNAAPRPWPAPFGRIHM